VKRISLKAVVMAIPLSAAVLVSVSTAAEASAAVTTPGPPTAVHATSVAGVLGATVSWGAPVSDGGSPILYYVASNYTGTHFCVSANPGPDTCHISGLRVGRTKPTIRVRAVSANGRGAVSVTLPVVTHQNPGTSGNGSPPTTSGTNQVGGSQTVPDPDPAPVPVTGTAGASTPGAASSAADPALPLTGIDVKALFVLGVGLVLGGLLMLGSLGRRRRSHVISADSLLQR
jgi:hypothetical protein